EVGELDGNLQEKLLRVLQERVFERPPDGRKIPVDVRLIVSTRRDLAKMAADGAFREDLHDVLSTFRVTVPPLKERPADIPVLARCFLARAAQRLGKRDLELTQGAMEALTRHGWPGNVRELENAMERAAMVCDSDVRAEDLLLRQTNGDGPVRWREIERQAIEHALHANAGNRTHTARQLGISLRKLQYRLKEYGLAEILPAAGGRH
ncbi:MAG: sigma-54-dependent Fis family transcriptional regulator, partial [Acidobacteriales bacterium]